MFKYDNNEYDKVVVNIGYNVRDIYKLCFKKNQYYSGFTEHFEKIMLTRNNMILKYGVKAMGLPVITLYFDKYYYVRIISGSVRLYHNSSWKKVVMDQY